MTDEEIAAILEQGLTSNPNARLVEVVTADATHGPYRVRHYNTRDAVLLTDTGDVLTISRADIVEARVP